MGGKRPDQHQLDVDEGGATDYKQYPDRPNEAEKDKESLGRTMKGSKKAQPIAPDVPSPEAERARGEQGPELKGAEE